MPPRLQLLSRAARLSSKPPPYQPLAPFLYPGTLLQPQYQRRNASILTSLRDTKGAYNKKIRRGRGPSSGKGKTSGRGHKGQKQHGKVPVGFNGGQTPDEVVRGKRGFENHFSVDMAPVNLNRIQYWINASRLDPSQPITLRELNRSRCIHGVKDGVKLLARGKEELTTPIHIVVSRASAEAITAVEKLGGTVTTRYYTPFAIKKIMKGEMDPIHSLKSAIEIPVEEVAEEEREQGLWRRGRFRLPDPTKRKDLEYYRDEAKRGYLSHLVEEGQGPSLYFKTPEVRKRVKKVVGGEGADVKAKAGDNRLW